MIEIEVFGRTDAGRKRKDNQDSMLIADLSRSETQGGFFLDCESDGIGAGRIELGERGALLIVADGMGGAAAGGTASRMAVAHIHHQLSEGWARQASAAPELFALSLRQAVEVANARIHEASLGDARFSGMGTTVTAAGVLGEVVYFAQVGDSRGYLIRQGVIVQQTRDQSVVQELVDAGTMSEEEAERSEHSNKILQALGAAPTVRVIVTHQPYRRGDLVVLCSDGLTRVLRKDEIAQTAQRASSIAALCDELVDLTNERGAPDNVTVVAARFSGALPEPAPNEPLARLNYEFV